MNELDLASANLIDGLLVVLVGLSMLWGFQRGFLQSALQLLSLVIGLVVALASYRVVDTWLQQMWPALGAWAAPLSFLLVYALAQALWVATAGRLVQRVPERANRHVVNRVLGILPGAGHGLINALLVSLVLLTLPLSDGLSRAAQDSRIAARLSGPAEWLESRLSPIFSPAIYRTLQALTVPVESSSTVKLPFQVDSPKVRPDLEARMLEMVNAERLIAGLKPLQADPELAEVARAHSRDMFARSYFSHVSPEGLQPFDRMRKAGVRYLAAGENLALAQTLPSAHQGLMNSPGHRANILRPQYGRAGIGVLDGGRHGLMITQKFRN